MTIMKMNWKQTSLQYFILVFFNLLLFAEAAEIVKDICVAVKFLHDMNIAHR